MIRLSALRWVPPFAQGLARDLRVRWALEEAGLAYEEMLIGPADKASPAYRAMQPFGAVPAIDDDGLVLFESGAIVMHLGERSPALMPADAAGKARVRTWMLAALNTVEPSVQMLNFFELHPGGPPAGAAALHEKARHAVEGRLDRVVDHLADDGYLVLGRFTAADLMMTTVLRFLRHTDLVSSRPRLAAYQARQEARPAFAKALQAQLDVFVANAAPAEARV